MPEELHYPSRTSIIQLGLDQPLPNLNIVLLRSSAHLLSRNSKLRTTSSSNLRRLHISLPDFRYLVRRGHVQWWCGCFLEDFPPDILRDMLVPAVIGLAAWIPVAAQIDVAVLLDEGGLEVSH